MNMAIIDTLRALGARFTKMATTPITLPGSGFTVPDELRHILAVHQDHDERAHQERIIVARRFHDGWHGVRLTERLREFLGSDCDQFTLRFNFTRKVNKAIAERLVIEGFEMTGGTETEQKANVALADLVWSGSRMKAKRASLVTQTVRDSEAFILVDYDEENQRPRWTPHQRWTSPEVTAASALAKAPGAACGDGEGVFMVYPDGDHDRKPIAAVKRWVERDGGRTRSRLNIYREDRIERWVAGGRGWEPYIEEGEDGAPGVWPTPWVDAAGQPLGIPVVHIKTPEMRPATIEAIPIQKAINKVATDLMAMSDSDAFRIIIALGWVAQDGDGNPLKIEPGTFVSVDQAGNNPYQPAVEVVEGSDLSKQIAVLDKLVAQMADVTDVPLTLINRSAQRAAEGTLQEEKESFGAKVRDFQDTIEQALEDAMKIARRLENAFGPTTVPEVGEFSVKWAPFAARSTQDKATEAQAMMVAGFPPEEIWERVWDYTPAQIAEIQRRQAGDGWPAPGGATAPPLSE